MIMYYLADEQELNKEQLKLATKIDKQLAKANKIAKKLAKTGLRVNGAVYLHTDENADKVPNMHPGNIAQMIEEYREDEKKKPFDA